jgi:transposase InsO family protein
VKKYSRIFTVRLTEIDDARLEALAYALGDAPSIEAIRIALREACERRGIERTTVRLEGR